MLAFAYQAASNILNRLRGEGQGNHPMDKALGIETSHRVSRRALASGSESDAYSNGYLGAHPGIVRKCLGLIPIVPGATFIDLGCGKGRALVIACEFPFAKLIGVELSPFVARIASRNFAKLVRRDKQFARVSIRIGDASQPPFEPGCNVLFFYNAFVGEPVQALIANLRRHLDANPTEKIWLVCYNPVSFEEFDTCGLFTRFFAAKMFAKPEDTTGIPGIHPFDSVIIYQSRTATIHDPLPNAEAAVVIALPNLGADVVDAG
jgi:SAM-dependent methyltransferase